MKENKPLKKKKHKAQHGRKPPSKVAIFIKRIPESVRVVIYAAAVVFLVALNLLAYAAKGYTGNLRLRTVTTEQLKASVEVRGIALRDENTVSTASGATSPLIENDGSYYGEIVEDGSSVALYQPIAYKFPTSEKANLYSRYHEVEKNLESNKKLKKLAENHFNSSTTGANITGLMRAYVDEISDGKITNFEDISSELNIRISTKNPLETINKNIQLLEEEKNKLENRLGVKNRILAPSSGYFVKKVDGFESLYDYYDVAKNGLTVEKCNKLLSAKPKLGGDYYGKIVYSDKWYFSFVVDDAFAGQYLKIGENVYIDFPSAGLSNVKMYISTKNLSKGKICVTCKSDFLLPEILKLRVTDAVVKCSRITGFKIPQDAVVTNNGINGVYTKAGSKIYFKPIDISYRTDEYAIVVPLDFQSFLAEYENDEEYIQRIISPSVKKMYKTRLAEAVQKDSQSSTERIFDLTDDLSDETPDEEKETVLGKNVLLVYESMYNSSKRVLKDYDRVVVRGNNLYDGKFIN